VGGNDRLFRVIKKESSKVIESTGQSLSEREKLKRGGTHTRKMETFCLGGGGVEGLRTGEKKNCSQQGKVVNENQREVGTLGGPTNGGELCDCFPDTLYRTPFFLAEAQEIKNAEEGKREEKQEPA